MRTDIFLRLPNNNLKKVIHNYNQTKYNIKM